MTQHESKKPRVNIKSENRLNFELIFYALRTCKMFSLSGLFGIK